MWKERKKRGRKWDQAGKEGVEKMTLIHSLSNEEKGVLGAPEVEFSQSSGPEKNTYSYAQFEMISSNLVKRYSLLKN